MIGLKESATRESASCEGPNAQSACFSYEHYNDALRSFKSAALGWLVQFAIRGELHKAIEDNWDLNNNAYRARPYLKLRSNAPRLRRLIRKKHILDEPALAEIGMTLYDFPVLATFFLRADLRNYVREPTANEIATYLSEMFQLVEKGESDGRPLSASPRSDQIGTFIKHLTRSQIEHQVGRGGGVSSPTHRLLCVNMSAPVSILKSQFLEVLERSAKQKNETTVMIDTWLRYGVLPFLDLRDSVTREGMSKIKVDDQIELIYDPELARQNAKGVELDRGAKTLNETTKPHALKILESQSQPFCSLAASASKELAEGVTFARTPDQCSDSEAAQEALNRWIPRTYPCDLSAFELAIEVQPQYAKRLRDFLEHYKEGGLFACSLKERIRRASCEAENLLTRCLELSRSCEAELTESAVESNDIEIESGNDDEDEVESWKPIFGEAWDKERGKIG